MGFEERRQYPRAKLEQLAYISLQSGNGGIVLNLSEGGLSFHAAGPMEAGKLIRFRLAVKAIDEIEATGELAWGACSLGLLLIPRGSAAESLTRPPGALGIFFGRLWCLWPERDDYCPCGKDGAGRCYRIDF